MESISEIAGYEYSNAELNNSHSYLIPALKSILKSAKGEQIGNRVFELGCGNGSTANVLHGLGYSVVGVDVSRQGIEFAQVHYPHLRLEIGSAYDELSGKYGTFDILVSLEVVEHVYAPRKFARTAFELLRPGGIAIISTPYHGYLKNLALALTGTMDRHFHALWDHGHIKFWSENTLTMLLREAGFVEVNYLKVGRIPPLAKSMVAVAKRP